VTETLNDLRRYTAIFERIQPWAGKVPAGYRVDFLGTLTDLSFENPSGFDPCEGEGGYRQTAAPALGQRPDRNGEFWFDAANWVLAANEAQGSYVMVTLGARFGYQAVGAYRALQRLNPMPCKLVAVDPVPQNIEWTRRHFLDNGIDPDDHWLVEAAVSDSDEPVLFPVGAAGMGLQNYVSANGPSARESYVRELSERGRSKAALRNLLLTNSTGITKDITPGHNLLVEIKFVSALALTDILGPFERVDFIEADVQGAEMVVFPPCAEVLKKKVRRIHMSTRGRDTHGALHTMFAEKGWEIVFSFEPDGTHESALGTFKTGDGVLTVRNPGL
jgi:FkbM family methyltransferase